MALVTTEGVDHVGIAVSDLARSARWYRDVLGLERVDGWGDYPVILVRGGSGVALFRAADAATGDASVRILHVAFRVADLDDAARRLAERGISFEREEHHGVARSLYLRDPDGHEIELIAYAA
jgi:catechol 2,3-dioxygenase-like lactoylglutathione lyase family enzyme